MGTELDRKHKIVSLVVIGSALAGIVVVWLTNRTDHAKAIGSFIYNFQTLIAGAAAIATLVGVRAQMRQAEIHHRQSIYLQMEPELYGLQAAFLFGLRSPLRDDGGTEDTPRSTPIDDIDEQSLVYIREHCAKYIYDSILRASKAVKEFNEHVGDPPIILYGPTEVTRDKFHAVVDRCDSLKRLSRARMSQIELLNSGDSRILVY